jgi:hypothetical protein
MAFAVGFKATVSRISERWKRILAQQIEYFQARLFSRMRMGRAYDQNTILLVFGCNLHIAPIFFTFFDLEDIDLA